MYFNVLTEATLGDPYSPAPPPNHSVTMDILIEETIGAGVFMSLGSVISKVSDADNNFAFDVSATFTAYLQDIFKPLASPIGAGHQNTADIQRRYKLNFTEKSGVTVLHTLIMSTPKTVWYGIDSLDVTFPPESDSTAWITPFPLYRFVNLEKTVLISWYNWTGSAQNFVPKFELYGRDNVLLTTMLGGGAEFPASIAAGQIVTYDLGNINFTPMYPLSIIGKMVVSADDSSLVVPMTFYNDMYTQENERMLIFRNRKGVFESMRCTGEFTQDIEVTRYESLTTSDYTTPQQYWGHRRQYDADLTTVLTFRTGYISKEEKTALAEMFITNDVWWLTADNKHVPLRLLDNKFEMFDSFENLDSVTFRCAPRNVEK